MSLTDSPTVAAPIRADSGTASTLSAAAIAIAPSPELSTLLPPQPTPASSMLARHGVSSHLAVEALAGLAAAAQDDAAQRGAGGGDADGDGDGAQGNGGSVECCDVCAGGARTQAWAARLQQPQSPCLVVVVEPPFAVGRCCAATVRFVDTLKGDIRAIFGRALAAVIVDAEMAAAARGMAISDAAVRKRARYYLSTLIAGIAQEFFAFWDELPAGVDDVSLAAKPRVVGIGGDKGSIVLEATVVKHADVVCGGGGGDGCDVTPPHIKNASAFCVKITRHSHHGLRTPKLSRVASTTTSFPSLAILTPNSAVAASDGGSGGVFAAAASRGSSPPSSVVAAPGAGATTAATTTLSLDDGFFSNPDHLPLLALSTFAINSTTERQFYGVLNAAADIRPRVAAALLVPLASLDPKRFGRIVDPPTVAQCLLLERWDGDLRWAKETFASASTPAKPPVVPNGGNDDSSASAPAIAPPTSATAVVAAQSAPPTSSASTTVAVPSFLRKFAKQAPPPPPPPPPPSPPLCSSSSHSDSSTPTPSSPQENPEHARIADIVSGDGHRHQQHRTVRHLPIFNTRRKFLPVTDFESLGCFAFQLFTALHEMHCELPHISDDGLTICSGYSHCDIHCGNILVRLDNRRICLCDFEHVVDVPVGASAAGAAAVDGRGAAANNAAEQPPRGIPKQHQQPFRITPKAYTPPELSSAPKRDTWAATLILLELFIGICPLVNAMEAGNDMSACFLTVDPTTGLDWRHFETLLDEFDTTKEAREEKLGRALVTTASGRLSAPMTGSSMREAFLDFCGSGLRNDPRVRYTAQQMLEHPFLACRTAASWETLINASTPFWK